MAGEASASAQATMKRDLFIMFSCNPDAARTREDAQTVKEKLIYAQGLSVSKRSAVICQQRRSFGRCRRSSPLLAGREARRCAQARRAGFRALGFVCFLPCDRRCRSTKLAMTTFRDSARTANWARLSGSNASQSKRSYSIVKGAWSLKRWALWMSADRAVAAMAGVARW